MPAAPTTRRTVLAGSLLTVAGCSVSGGGGNRSSTSAAPSATASLGTDEAIVADLVGRLRGSTHLLDQTHQRYPGLALAPLLALQRTQLSTLRAAVTAGRLPLLSPTPTPVAGSRDAALVQLRRGTTSLQQACLDAAGRAESGAFARLLASMGCALSQRLSVLPGG